MNAVFASSRFSAAAFGPCWQKSEQSICRLITGRRFPDTEDNDVRLGGNSYKR